MDWYPLDRGENHATRFGPGQIVASGPTAWGLTQSFPVIASFC
jgi:hypothetical protein